MDSIFLQMWNQAKPYYLQGRSMDLSHIEWMMSVVEQVCKGENLDISLLMPLAILHDVGYSAVVDPKKVDYFKQNVRRAHMAEGAKIAQKILNDLNYDQEKSKKIIEYVSIHDVWAFGEVDVYTKDNILGTFKDFDYLWAYTQEGCAAIKKQMGKTDAEMFEQLKQELSPIYGKKPFTTVFAKQLREQYLQEREKELS